MRQVHGRLGDDGEGEIMTGTLTFYDAAYPPAHPPKTDGVCIYIGGDAVHVWTAGDRDSQTARYRLPVFVRSNPPGPGAAADVAAAVAQLKVIGAPHGTLVAWDTETAADATYISGVYVRLAAAGYKLIVYGSQSAVMGNQAPDGLYWGADWTDTPHLHSGDAITQYVNYTAYDEDEAEASLPFWDTRPAPKGWTFPAPAGLHVVKQTREGYSFAWDAVTGPSGQKPTGYSACTYNAAGDLVNHQVVTGLTASEYGPTGKGLPAGTYRTDVWANGAPDAPPNSPLTVTLAN